MSIKRRLAVTAAIVAPLGLFLWARLVASWRPQKMTAQPVSFLIEDAVHGPWVDEAGTLRNLETEQHIVVPVDRRGDTPQISPDGRSPTFLGTTLRVTFPASSGASALRDVFCAASTNFSGTTSRHLAFNFPLLAPICSFYLVMEWKYFHLTVLLRSLSHCQK